MLDRRDREFVGMVTPLIYGRSSNTVILSFNLMIIDMFIYEGRLESPQS